MYYDKKEHVPLIRSLAKQLDRPSLIMNQSRLKGSNLDVEITNQNIENNKLRIIILEEIKMMILNFYFI